MILGTCIVLVIAIATAAMWAQSRWERQRVAYLRRIGMEPCERCGVALMKPVDSARGPHLCYCCTSAPRGRA